MSEGYSAMKAVLTDRVFSDPGWIFERKLDGERCGAVRRAGRVTLLSRTGRTLGGSYPELLDALSGPGPDLLVDGEIVALQGGQTSFERLQQRMQISDPGRARSSPVAIHYYLFDILELDGEDLRPLPLLERKARLRQAVPFQDPLRYAAHRRADGERAFEEACRRGWEGVIATQELVIGGWTAPRGSRERLGALLVGYYEAGKLRYAGKVGTGFDRGALHLLGDELERRERPTSPFDLGAPPRGARWARPERVAEIGFAEWTRDGKLRHPKYQGLRDDKPAHEVVGEMPS